MKKTLTAEETYNKVNLDFIDFKTTKDIEPLNNNIVRQDRAKEAIEFGLNIDKYGYNIYCSGYPSSRKKTYLKSILNEFAKNKKIPDDLCYVYNFEDKLKPILIRLPHGKGILFKKDMDNFSYSLKELLENIFENDDYEKNKELIIQKYEDIISPIYDKYNKKLEKYNYKLIEVKEEIYPVPVKDGIPLKQADYDVLDEKTKSSYLKNKKEVDLLMIKFFSEENAIVEQRDEEFKNYDLNLLSKSIKPFLDRIKKKYSEFNDKINNYIDNIYNDISFNIDKFKKIDKGEIPESLSAFFPVEETKTEDFLNYTVNLVLDNKDLKSAPVIFAENVDTHSLFGTTTFDVSKQVFNTDFLKINVGDIARANGGYLVINVEDLFNDYGIWNKFKSVLKTNKNEITSKYYKDVLLSNTLFPEPIDVNFKVVLIGDYYSYYILKNDSDFQELFKIHSMFEYDTDLNNDNIIEYIKFLCNYIKENKLKAFNKEAIAKIIEYSSRLAESKEKLTLVYDSIYKVLDEADAWATMAKKKVVDKESVEKALKEQRHRINSYEDVYAEYIKNNVFMINVFGEKVGEINGLTVIDLGDYQTGKPSKITANTYKGDTEFISIDRNVKLSGSLHDKGVETIRSFIGKTFASEEQLSLAINISFEQNYGGVDGDSATSTELYAVLSDMSNIPIKQSIAVTGSMNQKGEVQPIGGVNEKIEGFFNVCKLQGLNGEHGVIIPSSNVRNLMLSDEVKNAIKNKLFTIYAIDTINEGVEILMSTKYEDVINTIKNKIANSKKSKER